MEDAAGGTSTVVRAASRDRLKPTGASSIRCRPRGVASSAAAGGGAVDAAAVTRGLTTLAAARAGLCAQLVNPTAQTASATKITSTRPRMFESLASQVPRIPSSGNSTMYFEGGVAPPGVAGRYRDRRMGFLG